MHLLRSVLSTRFVNITLFIFLFLVSIGAAEEKHMKNGKANSNRKKRKSSKTVLSLNDPSSFNIPSSILKQSSSTSSSSYPYRKYMNLGVFIGLIIFYYSISSNNSKTEIVPTVNQTKPIPEKTDNSSISSLKTALSNVVHGFQTVLQQVMNSIQSIDYQYYYSLYLQFYDSHPIATIIILSILIIAMIVLLLFAIYAFCRFFLFLSDHKDQTYSLPQPSIRATRRQSMKGTKRQRVTALAPSYQSETVSLKPFNSIHHLCKSRFSQNYYNYFISSFLKNHSLPSDISSKLAATCFIVEPTSPVRESQAEFYGPPTYDYPPSPQGGNSSGVSSIHISPQEEHLATEAVITPMPTINSARDEEKSEERSRESIQQLQKQIEELQQQINGHFSQTIEKEDDNDSIDTLLMDGIDASIYKDIMKDINQMTTKSQISTNEATNTLKQSLVNTV